MFNRLVQLPGYQKKRVIGNGYRSGCPSLVFNYFLENSNTGKLKFLEFFLEKYWKFLFL